MLGWEHLKLKGAIELSEADLAKGDIGNLPARSHALRNAISTTSHVLNETPCRSYFERVLHQNVRISLYAAEIVLSKISSRLRSSLRCGKEVKE